MSPLPVKVSDEIEMESENEINPFSMEIHYQQINSFHE